MKPEALTEPAALRWLHKAARSIPAEQAIVELGVYQGASLAALSEGASAGNGAPVFGIDPWGMDGAYPDRPHMRKRYVQTDRDIAEQAAPGARLIQGFSTTEAARWGGPNVGLLFIDAVHREPDVLADFRAWQPRLAPAALVAFDDHDDRFPGVVRAVSRLCAEVLTLERIVGNRLAVCRL